MPDSSDATTVASRPQVSVVDIIRAVVLLAALATFAIWGFLSWELPLNIVIGIGAPIVVLLLWAVFLSTRAVVRLHPFIRALVEILIYVGVTLCWWSLGEPWVGLGFAVVAVASGIAAGRRQFA